MNRKQQIEMEMRELIKELEPDEPPKKNIHVLKIILVSLVVIAVIMLSVTYEPITGSSKMSYYPVDKSQIEVTITKANAEDDWPNVRISFGRGCSARRPVKPISSYRHTEI